MSAVDAVDAELRQAAFRVVGGSPTLEEVAAIAALLTARLRAAAAEPVAQARPARTVWR
ncbi:acyl-CoA carboxylase epsilon subunit, partial [Streptomyces bambusae]|nr:hypothetical protein [Streptomyces bambusae]